MNYLGFSIQLDESRLKPDFLDYLRGVEKDPQSKLAPMISAIEKIEPKVLNYFIKRGNDIWNGNKQDFENKSSLDNLFHSAWEDESSYSKRMHCRAGLFSGMGSA